MDGGKFGSFGWCWTSKTMDKWGSCSEFCPLFGPSKVLESRIEALSKKLDNALTSTTTTTTVTNATNVTNVTATAEKVTAKKTTTAAPAKKKAGKATTTKK